MTAQLMAAAIARRTKSGSGSMYDWSTARSNSTTMYMTGAAENLYDIAEAHQRIMLGAYRCDGEGHGKTNGPRDANAEDAAVDAPNCQGRADDDEKDEDVAEHEDRMAAGVQNLAEFGADHAQGHDQRKDADGIDRREPFLPEQDMDRLRRERRYRRENGHGYERQHSDRLHEIAADAGCVMLDTGERRQRDLV